MSPNQNIVISPFTRDCYEPVLRLWKSCEGIGLSEADSRESIARFLERNPGTSFVALHESALVGALLGGHDGRRGYLHHLAVHPDYRGREIGRALVEEALNAFRAQGIDKCHGFVFRENRTGLDFWRHNGWSVREDVCLVSRTIEG